MEILEVVMHVPERMALMGVLPEHGNILTLRLLREIKEAISFDDQEKELLSLEHDPDTDRVTWNPEADPGKRIVFGDSMRGLIADTLKKLDETKKLSMNHLPLYETFVEGNGDA